MHQLGLAMHNYHDSQRRLPQLTHGTCLENCPSATVGGTSVAAVNSWGREWGGNSVHTQFLPYIDMAPLYNQYNQDCVWHNGNNRTLARNRIAAFICPSDNAPATNDGLNSYGASTGPQLGWEASLQRFDGYFHRRACRTIEVLDGTSNTIAFAEFTIGDFDNGIFNLNRGDYVRAQPLTGVNTYKPTRAQLETYGQTCLTGTGNHISQRGNTWANPMMGGTGVNTITPPNWEYPNCHECGGCGDGDARGVWNSKSRHEGGSFHLFGDGAVRFINENVDFDLYQALGSAQGEEAITVP